MPGSIDHESSPQILRLVSDSNRYSTDDIVSVGLRSEELRESFEPSDETDIVIGFEDPFLGSAQVESVLFV